MVVGLAVVGTCGVVGRLGARLGLLASLQMVLLLVTSVVLDCLHQEGLILHLCFVVIPVVLPAVVLAHWGLSFGWVLVCFPVGLVLGSSFTPSSMRCPSKPRPALGEGTRELGCCSGTTEVKGYGW